MRQRGYQIEARRAAFAAWERGERSVLAHAPTGAGKSLIFSKVAEEWQRRNGGHVLVLAQDSRELVHQAAENLRRHTRLRVGVEMGRERAGPLGGRQRRQKIKVATSIDAGGAEEHLLRMSSAPTAARARLAHLSPPELRTLVERHRLARGTAVRRLLAAVQEVQQADETIAAAETVLGQHGGR